MSFFKRNKKNTAKEEIIEVEDQWRYGFDSIELQDDEVGDSIQLDWPADERGTSRESAQQIEANFYEEEFEEEMTFHSGISSSENLEELPVDFTDSDISNIRESEPAQEFNGILPNDPSLTFEENLRRRFGGRIKSALGSGTVVEGKFNFDEPVRIDGTLTGEVYSTSALIVGEQAVVNATKVEVGSLIILGSVQGKIQATDLVEIKSTGRLEGDVRTERIAIDEGGFFRGRCN